MKNHLYPNLKRLLFISSFILATSACWASYKHISFEVLNKDDGLNNNTIYAIMKDRDDCMWFATDLGLSKYDGMFFSNFVLPDITSPVIRLYEFDDGILLAQTTNGLVFAFDYINERQIPIICDDPNITDHPIRIASRSGENLYATGPTGLFDIKLKVDRSANELHFDVRKINGVADNLLFAATDPKGRLFSYVRGTTKILCYDPKDNGIRYIDFGTSHRLEVDGSVDRMRAFDDNLWIGLKYDGVLCYDFKTDKVVKLTGEGSPRPLFSRNFNYVLGVDKYNDTTYFAATQKGAFRMKFNGAVTDNKFDLNLAPTSELVFRKFIESQSMCVYVDKKRNLIWVGTFGGGVVKYDMNNEFYDHIDMGGVVVNSMFQDQMGYLWLATSGLGILKSDTPKLNVNTKFKLWDNPANDPTGRYMASRDNSSGLILFGQSDGVVVEFNDLSGEIQHFELRHPKNPKLKVAINRVFTDSKQRRWVATVQGLFSRRVSDADYKLVEIDVPSYGYGVTAVVEDTHGDIWIGTPNGVARLELSPSGEVKVAVSGLEEKFGKGHTQVYSMFINAKGQIVVGYVDRIYRINSGADSMEYICSLADNLPDGHITCMVDDKMGNTWFGTNAGMINIRSSGSQVFNYSSEGAIRSTCRLRDGRLVWSGSNGLMFFYPAIAYNDNLPSKLVLSAIYQGRTQLLPGVKHENGAKIEQNLARTELVELPYAKSSLTIFVSDLQYSITPKRIAYMLEPLMKKWEMVDSRAGVNFEWLPEGKYRLRVKSQFHDDTLGEESVFELVITPPWYDSWWMWVIYWICGAGLLFFCYMVVFKHVSALKEWYLSKIIEVSDSRVMEMQDQGRDMTEAKGDEKKILVVSSDKLFFKELESSLADAYRLIKSSTITDGFFAAMENMPSIIMCDVRVQGESGFDYCRKVKENLQTCHIPLLMFGDGAQSDIKAHRGNAADWRADAYLSKADGVDIFSEMFTRMLNNRDEIRQSVANYIGHHKDAVQGDTQSAQVDRDSEFVQELIEIIENNIDAPDFNVKRLAELTNMSQSTLYRRVMQNTQTSIVELVRDVRLNRAAQLMRENSKFSVQQVAEMVGYNDMATFRKHFSSMFGVTPSKYTGR